jgi:hypothetical protein
LRKGVADLHRRAQVSQRSNERYLEALAAVDDTTPCSRLFDAASRPVVDDGRRFRALRLSDSGDLALLEVIARGEFLTAGFRNRDLRAHLYSPSKTAISDGFRARQVACCGSCAPTVSPARCPKLIAINSPSEAAWSPQPCLRRATPASSNSCARLLDDPEIFVSQQDFRK